MNILMCLSSSVSVHYRPPVPIFQPATDISLCYLEVPQLLRIRIKLKMPMTISGSCHCGAIRFTLQSHTPVPYQQCACTICSKIGGPSGSINLGGLASTLQILQGSSEIRVYKAVKDRATDECFPSERNFCGLCSTMLWLYDAEFPQLIHPFAAAVDTDLPLVPEGVKMVCIFGGTKRKWVRWPEGEKQVYDEYLDESLEDWHKKHGVWVE